MSIDDVPFIHAYLEILRAELAAHKQASDSFAGGHDTYRYFIVSRQIQILETEMNKRLGIKPR